MSKQKKHIFKIFSPSGSHTILVFPYQVFPYQTGWQYSHGNPFNGGVKCRWGIGRNRDSGLIAGYGRLLYVRSAKNIYRRQSWVYDTVGHARLAIDRLLDVRTTKWQKQLPTTMQCTLHSRRHTIKCLFLTACSMDQYAKEKRTEKNLIVHSNVSEAETTNNKRLRSTFYIEAIQTRSIARPLCDSTASCWKCADAVYLILSNLVRACQNYSLLKLAHFFLHRYAVCLTANYKPRLIPFLV